MTHERLRERPGGRQKPSPVDDVQELARRLAGYERAAQQAGLSATVRLLLQAYVHMQAQHGAKIGQPGVSWAADGELARHLGRTVATVRRGRRELAEADGAGPYIAVDYVPPFHKLPNGEQTLHGANVVTVLGMVSSTSGGGNPTGSGSRQRGITRHNAERMIAPARSLPDLPLAA